MCADNIGRRARASAFVGRFKVVLLSVTWRLRRRSVLAPSREVMWAARVQQPGHCGQRVFSLEPFVRRLVVVGSGTMSTTIFDGRHAAWRARLKRRPMVPSFGTDVVVCSRPRHTPSAFS